MDNNNKSSILKSTREAKGLTLEIVHEATKVPMDALKAIEEGYSSRILSPFYYRGFIKIYAEFLGLDVKEMYKQYGLDEAPKPVSPPAASPSLNKSKRQEPRQPNFFAEQAQEWFSFIFKPKTLMVVLKAVGFLFLFFLLFKTAGCIASHLHKKVTVKRVIYRNTEEETPAEQAPVAVPPPVKHEIVQAQSQDNGVEVAVRAVKDTWLRVKTDSKVVFETTLSKGSLETWTASDRIELSGAHIEQLDMEINYKHIGFLGGGERRIRRVLITREGLTVKK